MSGEGSEARVFQKVDIPVTASAATAANIAEDLRNGETVTLEIEPSEETADQIEWQLENDRPVTKLVDDYTEDSE